MTFKFTNTTIKDLIIIEPEIFLDDRGFFYESFNERNFFSIINKNYSFVQDNISSSKKDVLRGLHYQIKRPQGKYLCVLSGEIFDVCVDIRKNSYSFGKWIGVNSSSENKKRLWVPPGIAHGFLVISEYAELLYKTTDYWFSEHERVLSWNDKNLNIKWPLKNSPILNDKDKYGKSFEEIEIFNL